MTYQVETDHQIVAFGNDEMQLFDKSGAVLTKATRANGVWTVTADGHADVQVPAPDQGIPPRRNVIQSMCDVALETLSGTGYSTLVPHGLEDAP